MLLAGRAAAADIKNLASDVAGQLKDHPGLKLVVMDFPYSDGSSGDGPARVQDELTSRLAREKGLEVFERKLLARILEEKKLQMSTGIFDEKTTAEFGRMTGAEAVAAGTLEDLDNGVSRVSLRVIKADTGKIIASVTGEVPTAWKRHMPDVYSGGSSLFTVSAGHSALPDINFNALSAVNGRMDFGALDVDKMEKYDKVTALEKSSPDLEAVITAWVRLADELPEYAAAANERAAAWRDYLASEKEYDAAVDARTAAMDADAEKVRRLLPLGSVPAADKVRIVQSFLDAYGWNNNPYRDEFIRYHLNPCVLQAGLGYCYFDGAEAFKAPYGEPEYFSEGLARAQAKNQKWGYINQKGELALKQEYSYADRFSEGLAQVCSGKKCGFIDKAGNTAVPFNYALYGESLFSDGLARVWRGGLFGFVNKLGQEVVAPKYGAATAFKDGFARVGSGGKYGFIDRTGREITPLKYTRAENFSEGRALVCADGKCGFIDRSGREVIPLAYMGDVNNMSLGSDSFSSGLASVCGEKQCGYIAPDGSVSIDFTLQTVKPFFGETAVAATEAGKQYFIGRNGLPLSDKTYSTLKQLSAGLAIASSYDSYSGRKYGLVTTEDKPLGEMKYCDIYGWNAGAAEACKLASYGDCWKGAKVCGLLGDDGRELTDFAYKVDAYAGSNSLLHGTRSVGQPGTYVDKDCVADRWNRFWCTPK